MSTGLALPALIAAVSSHDGKVTAVQRVYLQPDGLGKAGVSNPKLTLGRMRDGACRLAPAGRELGLSEGVETALSAMELYSVPVWAACGSRMDVVAMPPEVRRVVVFADAGEAGERAAERAAVAHERTGRAIAIVFPPNPHKDFNDFAQAEMKEAAE
jgi:DNA primase